MSIFGTTGTQRCQFCRRFSPESAEISPWAILRGISALFGLFCTVSQTGLPEDASKQRKRYTTRGPSQRPSRGFILALDTHGMRRTSLGGPLRLPTKGGSMNHPVGDSGQKVRKCPPQNDPPIPRVVYWGGGST